MMESGQPIGEGSIEASAKTQLETAQSMELDDRPRMGQLLSFDQPSLEQDFIASAHCAWMKCDAMTYVAVAFPSCVKIVSYSSPDIAQMLVHHSFVLMFGVVIPLMLRKCISSCPARYAHIRGSFMPFLKVFLMAGQAVVVSAQDPLDIWVPRTRFFMLRGLARTTVPPAVAISLSLPMPFKHHVFLQAVLASGSIAWIPKLTRVCSAHDGIRNAMAAVGQRTEDFLKQLSVFGFPDDMAIYPKEYPCWRVGLFYSIILEFLVPLLILYILEHSFRTRYLQSRFCCMSESECNLLIYGCTLMATVFLGVSCQLVWFKMGEY